MPEKIIPIPYDHPHTGTCCSTEQAWARKPREPDAAEKPELIARIKRLLQEQHAVLVAHYYVHPDLQDLAEATGGMVSDSLDMANFGHQHPAQTLVVAGVRFMGETAKILNPEKRVLMPDLEAECSLDLGCPADEFTAFCDAHPERTVVVYANTSAAVKARADWMVTSSIALPIIKHLKERGEKILWAPDRHLGAYVQEQTGADMLLWQGACVVHDEFKMQELIELKAQYPQAKVLVHPESPRAVVKLADVVGSTTQLIKASQTLDAKEFIVATDNGILHKMRTLSPHKIFLEAPTAGYGATCTSCNHCPWMAMNGLINLAEVLQSAEESPPAPRPPKGRMSDEATSQSTRLAKNADQVAGYGGIPFTGGRGGLSTGRVNSARASAGSGLPTFGVPLAGTGNNEIFVDPETGRCARVSIQRMLDFAKQIKLPTRGIGNV